MKPAGRRPMTTPGTGGHENFRPPRPPAARGTLHPSPAGGPPGGGVPPPRRGRAARRGPVAAGLSQRVEPMAEDVRLVKTSRLVLWASIVVVVAALYFAQEVLIPLALAVLFTFLLGPLVNRLERWRVPRVAAGLGVVLFTLGLFGGLAYMVERQFEEVAERLPNYTGEIRAKTSKAIDSVGWLQRAVSNIESTFKAANPAAPPPETPAGTPAGTPGAP